MLKYVPNILTIIRFLMIPIILYFVFTGNFFLAFIFFTFSGITDIADGFIARKFNLISNFGKLMDPLADKLTQIGVMASLFILDIIPFWILAIVVFKEVIMVAGASFLYGKDVVVYSRWYGKLSTVLFYLAIVTSLMIRQFETAINAMNNMWETILLNLDKPLYYCALVITIFSLIMYIKTLHSKGFIDKSDLNKDVTVEKNEKKKCIHKCKCTKKEK